MSLGGRTIKPQDIGDHVCPNCAPPNKFDDVTPKLKVLNFGGSPAMRVIVSESAPIIEIADGKDALGETRWIKALLVPDRRGLGEPVYEGWKEISQALGCSVRTAIRYARQRLNPLPIMYGLGGEPFIVRALLRAWLTARCCSEHPAVKAAMARKAKRTAKATKSGL